MDRIITVTQAWDDFWKWIKEQPAWSDKAIMSRREKQYLYKAKHARDREKLGHERIKTLLGKYAPDRYEFRETVILREKESRKVRPRRL